MLGWSISNSVSPYLHRTGCSMQCTVVPTRTLHIQTNSFIPHPVMYGALPWISVRNSSHWIRTRLLTSLENFCNIRSSSTITEKSCFHHKKIFFGWQLSPKFWCRRSYRLLFFRPDPDPGLSLGGRSDPAQNGLDPQRRRKKVLIFRCREQSQNLPYSI